MIRISSILALLLAMTSYAGFDFYAFHNGVNFGSFEKDAATLKELGYAGVNQVYDPGRTGPLQPRIDAYEKAGVKVLSLYLSVVDKPIPEKKVKPLANSGCFIELTINKRGPNTVEAVRDTCAMAEKLGIKVVLYPHHGFSVAKIDDALRLIEEVKHPNLGVMFNLCHYLKNEKAEDLEATLDRRIPWP